MSGQKLARATRADDIRVLDWLRMRRDGVPSSEIARLYGSTGAVIRDATKRVRDADLAESGEPAPAVRGGYA